MQIVDNLTAVASIFVKITKKLYKIAFRWQSNKSYEILIRDDVV
jgi:hypothetical protein